MIRKLIIAPYGAQRILFKILRKGDPFADIKFITKEQLLSSSSYSYSDDAVRFLISEHNLSYDMAKAYLKYLVFCHDYCGVDPKLNMLRDICRMLVSKDLLVKDEFLDYELSHSEIAVAGYSSKDKTIASLLNGYEYSRLEFAHRDAPPVYKFANANNQMLYVASEMAKLVESGVPLDNIYLYGLSNDDHLLFERISHNYGLHFIDAYDELLVNTSLAKEFFALLSSNDSKIAVELLKDKYSSQPEWGLFLELVKSYSIPTLSSERQLKLYRDVFSTRKISVERYAQGIRIIEEPFVEEDAHLFIINFTEGRLPVLHRDDDFLDDEEKAEIGLATSKDENVASDDYYWQNITNKCHLFISYSSKNASGVCRPSSYVSTRHMQEINAYYPTDFFSNVEVEIAATHQRDLMRKYLVRSNYSQLFTRAVRIPYLSYDSQIKGLKHYVGDEVLKLSYSKTKTYYACRYQYYLQNILKVDPPEDSFSLALGSLSHDIFEQVQSGQDFDVIYDELFPTYRDRFDDKGLVFMYRLHDELKKTFAFVQQFEDQITNPHIEREYPISVQLDANTILDGRLDKLILSGSTHQYLSIVDYKTSSSEEFKAALVPYGLSLQLPIYVLLCKNNPQLADKTILGIYIQCVMAVKFLSHLSIDNSEYYNQLLLAGMSKNDEGALSTLDSTLTSGSIYLKSVTKTKEGFSKNSRLESDEWFANMGDIAKNLVLQASQNIRANHFEIDPKIVKGNLISCKYCPYRDICFRSTKMMKVISNETGDEEENDG